MLLFRFCVTEVSIFSKDHDLVFLGAQGDSQMDWLAVTADLGKVDWPAVNGQELSLTTGGLQTLRIAPYPCTSGTPISPIRRH